MRVDVPSVEQEQKLRRGVSSSSANTSFGLGWAPRSGPRGPTTPHSTVYDLAVMVMLLLGSLLPLTPLRASQPIPLRQGGVHVGVHVSITNDVRCTSMEYGGSAETSQSTTDTRGYPAHC